MNGMTHPFSIVSKIYELAPMSRQNYMLDLNLSLTMISAWNLLILITVVSQKKLIFKTVLVLLLNNTLTAVVLSAPG